MIREYFEKQQFITKSFDERAYPENNTIQVPGYI